MGGRLKATLQYSIYFVSNFRKLLSPEFGTQSDKVSLLFTRFVLRN
jgi:hypothetical protein